MKIVAEIGASHNGSLERAVDTIAAAAVAGADAIKLQTWSPDKMDCGGRVLDSGPWKGHSLRDLYRKAHTPWEWHQPIIDAATKFGLEWWSTPFDYASVAFLESLHCPRYKIASFELIDTELIKRVAQTGKPVILSTGMATSKEIADAVFCARVGNRIVDLTLLKCVSAYPADPDTFNLMTMVDMGRAWGGVTDGVEVGISDHTQTDAVPVAAAVLGASMIERHLTIDREGGLDDSFASTPDQFKSMVGSVRTALAALGSVQYGAMQSELPSVALRRSLWIVEDIPAGETLNYSNLQTRRPADGLEPQHLASLLGKRVNRNLSAGTPMKWEYLKP